MPPEQGSSDESNALSSKLERTFDGALSYVNQVKLRFAHKPKPNEHTTFLRIILQYGRGIIDAHQVTRCVGHLFRGHQDLIQGLQFFLPPGYRIELEALGHCSRDHASRSHSEFNLALPFFRLPAELRIEMYHHALVRLVKLRSPNDGRRLQLAVYATNFADPNMRLVSKQFRDEYMYEAEMKTVLVVDDTRDYQWTFVRVPHNIQYVRTLEVYIRLLCHPMFHVSTDKPCNGTPELQMHQNWILKLTKLDLPALRSFSINTYLDPSTNSEACAVVLSEYEKIFTTLDNLASLRVYGVRTSRDWYDDTDYAFDVPRILGMRVEAGMDGLHIMEQRIEITKRDLG